MNRKSQSNVNLAQININNTSDFKELAKNLALF